MGTSPLGVCYSRRLMWRGGCSAIHLPMLRRVLGLAYFDERRGYAARLSPLLALVHWLPLLLDSPGQSALALLDNCAAPLSDLLAMVQQRLCLLLGQLMRFTLNLVRQDVMGVLISSPGVA